MDTWIAATQKRFFSMKFRVESSYPGKTIVSGLWEKRFTLPYTQQSHIIRCASIFSYCVRAWKCVRSFNGISIWKLGKLHWIKSKWILLLRVLLDLLDTNGHFFLYLDWNSRESILQFLWILLRFFHHVKYRYLMFRIHFDEIQIKMFTLKSVTTIWHFSNN